MLLKSDLLRIVDSQQKKENQNKLQILRESISKLSENKFRLLVITGIKNSGKTSFLFQLKQKYFKDTLYLNFAHPRFYSFDANDLFKLDEIIDESGSKTLFFDEVQKLANWNQFIQQKLEDGFKIVVTASDAAIFENESDTGFTGLNKQLELFPFSFNEFCLYNSFDKNEKSVEKYLKSGGFPVYLESGSEEYLNQLFDDLLIRVIATKFGVRDLLSFKRLALHLLSNVGMYITGNQIKSHLGIKTTSTVMEYLNYLEAGYLFYYLPKYSYSVRKQMINPRKVYAVDTGLVVANSASFTDQTEQLFENLVFLHLRRQVPELYYFSENNHCDFVVMKKNRVEKVVQVCTELKQDNLEKELNGVFEAIEFFGLSEGTIVTMNQTDRFERNGKVVQVVPFHGFS